MILVHVRGIANQELVVGYPGIPATKPRLVGTVQVRSSDGAPINISTISLAFYRTDSVSIPSNKVTHHRKEQSFQIGKTRLLFKSTAGRGYEEILGGDLPFNLDLPTDKPIPASITTTGRIVESLYQLIVTVNSTKQNVIVSQPVVVRGYDTLSTFGTFNVPKFKTQQSLDHIAQLEVSIPRSSFGPGDALVVYAKVLPNPDWPAKSRKIKLVRLSAHIDEIIKFNPNDEPVVKTRRIAKCTQQFDSKLPETGLGAELLIDFPELRKRDKDGGSFVKPRPGFPAILVNGFTTASSSYTIEHLLTVKAKTVNCKDMIIEEPITITPFTHAECKAKLAYISTAVEVAKREALESKKPHPSKRIIYKPGDSKYLRLIGCQPATATKYKLLID